MIHHNSSPDTDWTSLPSPLQKILQPTASWLNSQLMGVTSLSPVSLSVSVVNNMQIYKISKASRWANESLCCSLTACRYIHRLYAHLVTLWTDGGDVVIQWVNTLTPGESITSHLYSSAAKNYNAIKCQRRWTEPPLIECDDIIFVFATSQTLCCWIFPVKKHNDSLDSWLTRWTRVLTDVILSKSL